MDDCASVRESIVSSEECPFASGISGETKSEPCVITAKIGSSDEERSSRIGESWSVSAGLRTVIGITEFIFNNSFGIAKFMDPGSSEIKSDRRPVCFECGSKSETDFRPERIQVKAFALNGGDELIRAGFRNIIHGQVNVSKSDEWAKYEMSTGEDNIGGRFDTKGLLETISFSMVRTIDPFIFTAKRDFSVHGVVSVGEISACHEITVVILVESVKSQIILIRIRVCGESAL